MFTLKIPYNIAKFCLELGHISRSCKEERAEGNDRVEIKCSNCEGAGHRVRDCRQQRKHKHGCRNCGYVAVVQTTNWIMLTFMKIY